MNKFNFKKLVSRFKPHLKYETSGVAAKWKIMFMVFVFLLLIISFLSAYLFWQFRSSVENVAASKPSISSKLQRKSLEEVVGHLEKKERRFNEVLLRGVGVFDPS
jgi:cell division septal protein FtsQ